MQSPCFIAIEEDGGVKRLVELLFKVHQKIPLVVSKEERSSERG